MLAAGWEAGVETVFVVGGSDFPDALTAAARAGATGSPVLLTDPAVVPDITREELVRLAPQSIVVVGGTDAVSEDVATDLQALTTTGQLDRLAGTDRYETAAEVAGTYPVGVPHVYLTSGTDFPDALAVAALAGHQGVPVILSAGDELSPPSGAALDRLQPEQVVVIGGTEAISDSVAEAAAQHTTGKTVERIAGENRYETASLIASGFANPGEQLFVTSGEDFPDALVGAAVAAGHGAPLLLSPGEGLHEHTVVAVERTDADYVSVVGGTGSLSTEVFEELQDLVQDPELPGVSIGTTGALPVGQAEYAVPAGAVFVATDGSDDAAGTETAPLQTVDEALDRAQAGSTIVLRGGTYHERFSIYESVTIQNYPGEAVWFDGSVPVSGFVDDGDTWRVDGWTAEFDSSPTFEWGEPDGTEDGWRWIDPDFPMAAHPDQVWIDGAPQAQVGQLNEVVDGTFYVDYDTDRLYLGSDPSGKTVRASALDRAMEVRATGATLRGFGVRRYAPSVPHMGTITIENPEITAENLVITDNATTGLGIFAADSTLHRLTVQRNGLMGMVANYADDIQVSHVVASDNNVEHFNQAPVSGGFKITRSRGVTVSNAMFEQNDGPGFWADVSAYDIELTNSVLRDNEGHGMSLEISALATVAGNLIQGNDRHGIKVNNTSEVSIWNNTLADNGRPLNIVQDARRGDNPDDYGHDPRRPFPDPTMPWINGPVTVRNNIVAGTTGNCLLCVEDYSGEFSAEEMEVTANGNVYQRDAASQPEWVTIWSRGADDPAVYTTLSAFRSGTGQETRSLAVQGSEAVNADGSAASQVLDAIPDVAVQIPSPIADLLGVPAGVRHLGAFID